MAKGFARLGVLLFSVLTVDGAGAITVGEVSIREVVVDSIAVSDIRGERFEPFDPLADTINPRNVFAGDDGDNSHRFETDLLILPGHFLTLVRIDDTTLTCGHIIDAIATRFPLGVSV